MRDRRQDLVNVYRRIMGIVFQRLSPTFGERTIAAIAKNAVARQGRKHPLLRHITVEEKGVQWDTFQAHMAEVPEDELAQSLDDFMDEFFDAVSNLIGRLVVGKLFKEAEEMAKQGDEQ